MMNAAAEPTSDALFWPIDSPSWNPSMPPAESLPIDAVAAPRRRKDERPCPDDLGDGLRALLDRLDLLPYVGLLLLGLRFRLTGA